ncbi:hypothetical protein Tco_0145015 [Tanacetum coccineum]
MRLNELHKFSDGTLTRVMEKLDQMVKDFHLYEYNKGMETRKWSEDDKRWKHMTSSQQSRKGLQIRRIYRSLESFVFHSEDGNPARANIKQALGYLNDGVGDGKFPVPEMSMSKLRRGVTLDVHVLFTSAQDGDPLQDDVRLCLGDDLKKAQDHSQRQAKSFVYKL